MEMGEDRFVWVHWGAGTRGNTKSRQVDTKNDHTGHNFDAMTGGISPDMMFVMVMQW